MSGQEVLRDLVCPFLVHRLVCNPHLAFPSPNALFLVLVKLLPYKTLKGVLCQVILLVRFGSLSGHLLGNSCPLG